MKTENMIGEEELVFVGKYKGLDLSVRYNLKNATERDTAGVLCEIVKKIEPFAYELSGIDCKKIDDIASKAGNSLSSIARYIRENPIRSQLEDTLDNELLISAAESYFFNRVFANAGIPILPEASSNLKPENETIENQIVFIGRYGEWVVIKKLTLEDVKDWEVSAILSGIVETAVRKAFYFCGEREEIGVGEGRKSFKNAADLLDKLATKMGDDRTKNAYLIVKSLEALDYSPHANVKMLTLAHPELKVKKPRGRIPKG